MKLLHTNTAGSLPAKVETLEAGLKPDPSQRGGDSSLSCRKHSTNSGRLWQRVTVLHRDSEKRPSQKPVCSNLNRAVLSKP